MKWFHRILLIPAALFLWACSACEIEPGLYENMGGSETYIALSLNADEKASLVHETWQPGHHENRESSTYTGSWICRDGQISLRFPAGSVVAKRVEVGPNPLGLAADTQALQLNVSDSDAFHWLNDQVLYRGQP